MTDEPRTSSHDPGQPLPPADPPRPAPEAVPARPRTRAERRADEQAALVRQSGASWSRSAAPPALPAGRPATGTLPTAARTGAVTGPDAAAGSTLRPSSEQVAAATAPDPTGSPAWQRVATPHQPAPAPSAWRERAARFAPNLPTTTTHGPAAAAAAPPAPPPAPAPAPTTEPGTAAPAGPRPSTRPAPAPTTPALAHDVTTPAGGGPSTPFPTRRQLSHAARHVTRLGRGNAARLLLLAVVTAIAVEMVRASGPLLDRAFAAGVTVAAGTALVTYAAPALAVTIIAARLPITGRVTLGAVLALVGWRLGLQGLAAAAGTDGVAGSARYGLGLGGASLAVATLVIVAAFVSGARALGSDGSPERADVGVPLAHGRLIALGVSLGVLGAAGVSLLYGTWDPYWRTGLLAWLAPLALGGLAAVSAWLLRHDPAAPGARGFWVLGPYLALGVMVFGNPAFVAAQTGLPLAVAGAAVALTALLVGLMTVGGAAGSRRPGGPVLPAFLGRSVGPVVLLACTLAVFALPGRTEVPGTLLSWVLLGCVVGLALAATHALVHALTRPAQDVGWLRLAGASTAVGLGLVLPLLVYQLDYDVPLPVPNAAVPVLVALAVGAAGLRRAGHGAAQGDGRGPQDARGAAATAHLAPPSARVALPVVAAVAVLAAGGAAAQLVDLPAGTPASAVAGTEPGLVVLDWNLHYGVSATPSVELDDVAATIRDSGAQVVTLQEVSRGWVLGGGVDMAGYLARATGMEVAFVGAADRQFGNAVLWDPDALDVSDVSRTPLPYGAGPQHRSAISATLTPRGEDGAAWDGGLRVTSVHLQHRRESTPTRVDQLDALFAAEPVEGAYLLAGDLNAEPGWEEVELVGSQGLVSGQDEAGDADALTSPADAPRHRIDWVFGAGLTFERFRVLDDVASDHRPLVTVVRPAG